MNTLSKSFLWNLASNGGPVVAIGLGLLASAACSETAFVQVAERNEVDRSGSVVDINDPNLQVDTPDDLAGQFSSNPALQRDIYEQTVARAVDILWVVDNSGSMVEEQRKLAANFSQFFQFLNSKKVDYHIGVTTTDTASIGAGKLRVVKAPNNADISYLSKALCESAGVDCNTLFATMSNPGTNGSPEEKGIDAAALALSEPNLSGANAGFVRDDANLAVVVVSDEEDSSFNPSIDYYARLFDGLKGYGNNDEVTFSAIAGAVPGGCITQNTSTDPRFSFIGNQACSNGFCSSGVCVAVTSPTPDFCTKTCQPGLADCPTGYNCGSRDGGLTTYCIPDSVAAAGSRYFQLTQKTNGIFASICEPDFVEPITELGFTVAGLRTEFDVSRNPQASSIQVRVTGSGTEFTEWQQNCPSQAFAACGTAGVTTWCYDAAKRVVRFTDDCRPPEEATIEIAYRTAN